jgi:HK97 family phage prohead protease
MAQQTPDKRAEFRARPLGFELRDDGGGMPTLVGHLAVFNEWAEINSVVEGHFLERIDPGAFTKTISESRDQMRVLFQHGKDPTIGDKPLGPIRSLEEDETGLAYEVDLLDTSYNRDIVAMLAADPPVLGSSFRFKVMRESVDRKPARSEFNPRRLPERTVQEVKMQEFGPVTFPAYAGAKAGLRSLTDRMLLPVERFDNEDLSILAQMIVLGTTYIEEQDEPGDEANIPVMQGVLTTLYELQSFEVTEDEGTEAEDEEASSDGRSAPPTTDAAPDDAGTSTGTPRTVSWQMVASLDPLRVPEKEDSWTPTI